MFKQSLLSGWVIRWEKRLVVSPYINIAIPVVSIILALMSGGIVILAMGFDPLSVYRSMFANAFLSTFGLMDTAVKAIPLMLAGLGVALAFRMLLWNIGAEGQLHMGAFAASGVALAMPQAPAYIVLPAMFAAGMLAGSLWALLAALPRAYLRVNEIIVTLLLNYVAIYWVDYLVFGPWRDPGALGFPITEAFSAAARLPNLGDTRIHLGLIIGLIVALLLYFVIYHSRWGYEVRVIGESQGAARYAGMDIRRNIILVMVISGALAGIAGMIEISAIHGRLQPGFSPGYGYTAIIVASLARMHPGWVVIVSFLLSGLLVGGFSMQIVGLPLAVVSMLQGAILFFLLGSDTFARYRLTIQRKRVA
jgi:simple sugar transport system permease protein